MKTRQKLSALSTIFILSTGCATVWTIGEVPFIATPMEVADRMLEMAEVRKDDVLYDLGSGDGRIVILAAKRYGARGVGIEIDPDLVEISRERARQEGVNHLVEFRLQDALTVDVSSATVVTLYLAPEFNEKLRPVLRSQLKPGSRVVSHDFDMADWAPDKVETIAGGMLHDHTIYLWKIK